MDPVKNMGCFSSNYVQQITFTIELNIYLTIVQIKDNLQRLRLLLVLM